MPIYTYTTLDDPNVAGGTSAFGINAEGQIVGRYITSPDGVHHGFLYSNGTYTTQICAADGTKTLGGTYVLVYQRQRDGTMKIRYDSFNSVPQT